jgi:hypothetical protein
MERGMSGKTLSMTRLDSGRRYDWKLIQDSGAEIAHGRMLLTLVGRPHAMTIAEEREAVRTWVEKFHNDALAIDVVEYDD